MNKYLEALKQVYYGSQGYGETDKYYKYLKEYLESIDNANPSEALECLLNKVFGYGVQSVLDNLLFRGYNTKNMLEEQYFGKTLEQDLDEAKTKIKDLKNIDTIKQALLKAQEQEKENELLKEIIKSFFDRGCPLHQYTDKDGMLLIEVDDECSLMHLGKFKSVDLDAKLKEVLE